MNDAQRNTIVTVLANEIANASVSYGEGKAYYDHLRETLKAFHEMWDNQQMVKEEEDVGFARPCEHPQCSNWIEDPEWKYGWCEDCQDKPEPDGYYEESDRQFEVNRGN